MMCLGTYSASLGKWEPLHELLVHPAAGQLPVLFSFAGEQCEQSSSLEHGDPKVLSNDLLNENKEHVEYVKQCCIPSVQVITSERKHLWKS